MESFGLEFTMKNGEYVIEHYTDEDELEAVYEGEDFGDLLRHAIYDIDPLLAASAWTKDYLEFSETHKIEETELDDE